MRTLSVLATAVLSLAAVRPAAATNFFVYKASLKLVVQRVEIGQGGAFDTFVTKKLGNAELINLALGRPLDTKIDPKTEILAGAGTFSADAAQSKLIVFDPTQNGVAQIKATIGTVSTLDFTHAYLASKSQGAGFGTAVVAATTAGDPNSNGFLQSTFFCNGAGSGTHDGVGGNAKVSGKGSGTGRLMFKFTDQSGTHTFDGIVAKSEGKVSGKPIGGFAQ
ncbi:MAG TPA: hypothetical protein VGK30_12430 [Candidatus Binatia bacterium]